MKSEISKKQLNVDNNNGNIYDKEVLVVNSLENTVKSKFSLIRKYYMK